MDNKYIKYEKDNKEVIAEEIFVSKKPRSRVMLSTVKDVKAELDRQFIDNNHVINYESVKKIDGIYYLISSENKYYPSLIEKIKKENIDLETAVDWGKQIINIWNNIKNEVQFPFEIKLNYFRVDEKNNIKLVNPFINKQIEQYKYPDLNDEFDEIYWPPEVINRENWDEKARIYNFGVILYYLTTNKFPFQGKDKKSMYDKKMTGSVIEPKYIKPEISAELSGLIDSMVKNDIKKRPDGLHQISKTIEDLSQNNSFKANEAEKQSNLNKSTSKFKRNRWRERFVFYFRHHWGKTLLFVMLIGLLVGITFIGGNPPVITENTTPDDVVKLFYSAIDEKDPIVIDQAATADLGQLERMISEGHVMETMRTAYGNLPDEEKTGNNKVFGVKDLKINRAEKDNYYIYDVNYIFYYPRDEIMREKEMQDTLTVKKVEKKWQITDIEGSVVQLIEGEFEG